MITRLRQRGRAAPKSLPDFMRRAALGEAMAHLRALEARGLVWEEEGEPSRWRRSDAGAALHS